MKDRVIRFCVSCLNLISVGLIMRFCIPAETLAERFLRGFLAGVYLATLISLTQGGEDEDN
jgi:hypothetical protein